MLPLFSISRIWDQAELARNLYLDVALTIVFQMSGYSRGWRPMTGATRSEDLRRWRGELARSTPRALRQEGQDRRQAPRVHSMHPCRRAGLAWRGPWPVRSLACTEARRGRTTANRRATPRVRQCRPSAGPTGMPPDRRRHGTRLSHCDHARVRDGPDRRQPDAPAEPRTTAFASDHARRRAASTTSRTSSSLAARSTARPRPPSSVKRMSPPRAFLSRRLSSR